MIDMTNKTECISIHALLLEKAEFNSDYAEEIQCLFKLINPEAYENGFAYGKINESDDLLNAAEQALKDCFDKEYIPNTIKSQIPTKWFEKIKRMVIYDF